MEFNPNYYDLGYHSVYFLININNMILPVIFFTAALIVLMICPQYKVVWLKRIQEKLRGYVVWNGLLSFLNETLIIFALACFMQYKYYSFETFGKGFTSFFSLVFGVIVCISLLMNIIIMLKYKNSFQDQRV